MVKVPDGRYAVEADGVIKFYKINTPTRGKWAGYTFVEVQASDDFYPVKDRQARTALLGKIGADPRAALALYGKTIERCGICGKTLTKTESRERGIGPVCAEGF